MALSSGESELYASLKAVAETLGLMSMLKDLNWKVAGQVYGDASAALDIIRRTGLGKTRHIDTSLLWIQQTVAELQLKFSKVLGKNNPADLYTKYLDIHTINTHTRALNYHTGEGRAEEAPEVPLLSKPWMQYISIGEKKELGMVTTPDRSQGTRKRQVQRNSVCSVHV